MSSVQGVVIAVAMAAVCGAAVIHLAFKLQKSLSAPPLSPPRPCIASGGKKEKRRKKVRFAKDVAEPSGNGEEFRKRLKGADSNAGSSASTVGSAAESGRMPANRVALYNGILRDRGIHRMASSC